MEDKKKEVAVMCDETETERGEKRRCHAHMPKEREICDRRRAFRVLQAARCTPHIFIHRCLSVDSCKRIRLKEKTKSK